MLPLRDLHERRRAPPPSGLGLAPGDAARLHEAICELGALQAQATLSRLAAGLPVDDLRFALDRSVVVEPAGFVARATS